MSAKIIGFPMTPEMQARLDYQKYDRESKAIVEEATDFVTRTIGAENVDTVSVSLILPALFNLSRISEVIVYDPGSC